MMQLPSPKKIEIHKIFVETNIKLKPDGTWNNIGKARKHTTFASIPQEIEKAITAKQFSVNSIHPTRPTIIGRIISNWCAVAVIMRCANTNKCLHYILVAQGKDSIWSILNLLSECENSNHNYSSIANRKLSKETIIYQKPLFDCSKLDNDYKNTLIKTKTYLIKDLQKKEVLSHIHSWSQSKSNLDGTPVAWASNAEHLESKDFNVIHVISNKGIDIHTIKPIIPPANDEKPNLLIFAGVIAGIIAFISLAALGGNYLSNRMISENLAEKPKDTNSEASIDSEINNNNTINASLNNELILSNSRNVPQKAIDEFGHRKSTRYTICTLVEVYEEKYRPTILSLITEVLEKPDLPKRNAIHPNLFEKANKQLQEKYAIEWSKAIYRYQEKHNLTADGIVNYGGRTIKQIEKDLYKKLSLSEDPKLNQLGEILASKRNIKT